MFCAGKKVCQNMDIHPYISYTIVPNPSSGVSKTVADSDLKGALERNLALVRKRDIAFTPPEIYAKVMARPGH